MMCARDEVIRSWREGKDVVAKTLMQLSTRLYCVGTLFHPDASTIRLDLCRKDTYAIGRRYSRDSRKLAKYGDWK
jgi:hypothetical protein